MTVTFFFPLLALYLGKSLHFLLAPVTKVVAQAKVLQSALLSEMVDTHVKWSLKV